MAGWCRRTSRLLSLRGGRIQWPSSWALTRMNISRSAGNVAFRDIEMWAARLFAERQAAIGQRAYWYCFTHEPPVEPGGRDLKATHATEIPYVLNNLSPPRSIPVVSSPRLASQSQQDRALAERISSYWVNFAKTGDPNGKNLPTWPRFRDRDQPPYVLGATAEIPSSHVLNAYDERSKKLLETLTSEKKR